MVKVVNNDPKYYDFIRLLRSDPRVQDGFIEVVDITKDQQRRYMEKHHGQYIVALFDDKPAGFAGSINNDIRVCVHPDYQGKGVGKNLISELMKRFPTSFAKVKIENEASKKLFESCGFRVKYWLMEK